MLKRDFFNQATEDVAKQLLGKFLVRRFNGKEITAMITETEAYDGFHDMASHAFKGRTARTETMFGPPGAFYVYLCYGMHHMLNIVTREKGCPAAVLIRGAVLGRRSDPLLDGPGKITRFLHIDKALNGKYTEKSAGLWIESRNTTMPVKKIKATPRVGVAYAGIVWSAKKLRFVISL